MAVPTYTTDLSTFELCEASSGYGEFTNMADGGSPEEQDTDDIIQGSYHLSAQCSLKVGELQSLYVNYGSGATIPTDGAIFIWFKFDAGGILDTYDNGGVRFVVGSSATNWDAWKAGGVNRPPNPYGGYRNYALNPTARTYDYRNSSGTGTTYQYTGMAIDVTAAGPTKGYPFKIDGVRFGRGDIRFEYGSSGDGYANFADAAAENDANNVTDGYNRWGLFQNIGGGTYLWKGRMQLGTPTNAVEMEDSDVTIRIDDVVNCTANFNTIEVNHADTVIDWTNVVFKALGTTSPGRWVSNADADVTLTRCQFINMGEFTFDSNFTVVDTAFPGCGQVTTGGASMAGCSFIGSSAVADDGSLYCDTAYTDTDFDDCTFEMGSASHHAIDFGTSVTSNLTLRNCSFAGFGSTGDSNDSTVRFLATSGSLTLSLVNCTVDGAAASESNFSVDDAAGVAVSLSIDPVTVQTTCVKTDGTVLEDVRVFVSAIAKSSGTATTNTASKLVDTAATFETDGVAVNDVAFNQTDGTSALVSAVDSETSLSLASDAFPDGDEDYRVGGAFPDEDTVTIVNSGTTATVTHTGHGMASNDYVYIEGGSLDANEGVYQIIYINANSYSYTMLSTPGSSPTGTIKATFVALFGLSNASGIVTTSRVYSTPQPVNGWARNTVAGSPYLQEGIITGTISSSAGLLATAVLVSDE